MSKLKWFAVIAVLAIAEAASANVVVVSKGPIDNGPDFHGVAPPDGNGMGPGVIECIFPVEPVKDSVPVSVGDLFEREFGPRVGVADSDR